ncbi:hypothetical protein KP509_13G047900 [Ceratopteris richardii]|nr:hypothetical protein KP509_13G047900 [Ceratopteris richardii]
MGSSGSDGGYVYLSSPQANEQQGEISSRSVDAGPQYHSLDQYRVRGGDNDSVRTHPAHVREHLQNISIQSSDGNAFDKQRLKENDETRDQDEVNLLPRPLLDIEDVRYVIDDFLHRTYLRRHPDTSLTSKMPWHEPRAPFLARGLEWPPETFESAEARVLYYRQARKRKPFLAGSPPLWTVPAFNLAFMQLLMYNPLQKLSDYLSRLP